VPQQATMATLVLKKYTFYANVLYSSILTQQVFPEANVISKQSQVNNESVHGRASRDLNKRLRRIEDLLSDFLFSITMKSSCAPACGNSSTPNLCV